MATCAAWADGGAVVGNRTLTRKIWSTGHPRNVGVCSSYCHSGKSPPTERRKQQLSCSRRHIGDDGASLLLEPQPGGDGVAQGGGRLEASPPTVWHPGQFQWGRLATSLCGLSRVLRGNVSGGSIWKADVPSEQGGSCMASPDPASLRP